MIATIGLTVTYILITEVSECCVGEWQKSLMHSEMRRYPFIIRSSKAERENAAISFVS